MGLLNFPIRRIFYFIVEKNLFNIPIELPCADDPVCVAATEDF